MCAVRTHERERERKKEAITRNDPRDGRVVTAASDRGIADDLGVISGVELSSSERDHLLGASGYITARNFARDKITTRVETNDQFVPPTRWPKASRHLSRNSRRRGPLRTRENDIRVHSRQRHASVFIAKCDDRNCPLKARRIDVQITVRTRENESSILFAASLYVA